MTINNFTVKNLEKTFGAIITDIKLSDITSKQARRSLQSLA